MKLNLYHKTFITTFITAVLTLASFTLILHGFTGVFLKNLADDQFKAAIKDIEAIDTLEDFTIERINKIEETHQTTIRLFNANNDLIYPRLGGYSNLQFFESTSPALRVEEGTSTDRIVTKVLDIEGNIVIAWMSYNANMRAEEVQQIFLNMIPVLAIIALIMSLIASYVYSKSAVKKINVMNEKMEAMAQLDYDDDYHNQQGDELTELENHIHDLYTQLMNEMEKIRKFELDRQVFMRGTIHELKTPIMIIDMQVRDLFEYNDLDEKQIEHLVSIQNRLDAMRQLVNGGLDISRLESITETQTIDLEENIKTVLEYYETMIEDKNLKIDVLSTPQTIPMHEKHLTTILSNLISNAIRYSEDNATIYIDQDQERFEIKNTFEKEIENGDSLSKPFVKGNKDEDGHGLGLYIVSTIISKYELNYTYTIEDNTFIFSFEY